LKKLKNYVQINKNEVLVMCKRVISLLLSFFLISMIVVCGIKKEAKLHNNKGVKYFRDGEISKAISEFKKAIEISPKFAEAHYNLGNVYSKIDSIDDAMACWQKTIELDKTNATAVMYIGLAHFKKGELDSALYYYEKAITMDENLKNLSNPLRDTYFQKKREEKAIAEGKMWARQIVVKTRREALRIIKQLDQGADFADLAIKYSIDTKTNKHGGDLGFFFENQKSKFIVENVKKLKKGEYSKKPIKSDQGYVIFLRLN